MKDGSYFGYADDKPVNQPLLRFIAMPPNSPTENPALPNRLSTASHRA